MLTEPCMVVRSVHDLDVCWCVAHPLKCLLPAYRCLPYHLSNWTEMRQETLDAVPSLESQTYSDDSLPEYLLQGTFDFKAIRVYDGDTIWAAVIVRDQAWKIQCRLLGIDAPEMPSSRMMKTLEQTMRCRFQLCFTFLILVALVAIQNCLSAGHMGLPGYNSG
eukprot:843556-Pelagomonas_calceolata.AAC.5